MKMLPTLCKLGCFIAVKIFFFCCEMVKLITHFE
jgi:hypothetical protein